jgi:sodium-dependent dicarboxylate transporter 2/3/5
MTAMVTEIASNTATANILVPILGGMSITMCQNPIYLMLSTAITCSYAFMLPVATAPNAIVFGASTMGTGDMMKAGIFMNFVCVLTTSVAINTYGSLMFGLDEFPSWAHEYGNDNTTMERCVTNLTALTSPIV